jgi:hypothetical protein
MVIVYLHFSAMLINRVLTVGVTRLKETTIIYDSEMKHSKLLRKFNEKNLHNSMVAKLVDKDSQ